MPCRPQVCRRLVAQTPSTRPASTSGLRIWISDDLLAEAFNSYLRVSPAYRRYGSHVPGPLEARRRTARRRMGGGLAAVGTPPPPDMGALFGLGGATKQPSWSWQAPAPPSSVVWRPPVPAKAPPWTSAAPSTPAAEHELESHNQQVVEMTAVEASQESFEDLLEACTTADQTENDVDGLVHFLNSPANEPDAMNTLRLVEWLGGQAISDRILTTLCTLLMDKLKLDTIGCDEFVSIFDLLPSLGVETSRQLHSIAMHSLYMNVWHALSFSWRRDSLIVNGLLKAINASVADINMCTFGLDVLTASTELLSAKDLTLPLTSSIRAIVSADLIAAERMRFIDKLVAVLDQFGDHNCLDTLTLATWTRHIGHSDTDIAVRKATCSAWLQILRMCRHTSNHDARWDAVYAELAPLFRPSELADHFKGVRSIDFARLLLDSWLPHADLANFGRLTKDTIQDAGMFRVLRGPQSTLTAAALSSLLDTFDQLCEQELADGPDTKLTHPLALLLSAFALHEIDYTAIAAEIMQTCKLMHAPAQLHNTFSAIFHCRELSISKEIALNLLQHFLKVNEPTRALNIFIVVPSISIADCPELPKALIAVGKTDVDLIAKFQHRQPEILALGMRSAATLSAPQTHTDAIRLLAHELSRSNALNARTALRRVWMCYRYLRDRGAHMSLLMSRALVHVGIVRFFREGRVVPQMRIDWVLKTVKEVEGEVMAAEVRALVYLIQRKTSLRSRDARKNQTSERLPSKDIAATRWRLKVWAKERPERIFNGNDAIMSYTIPPGEQVLDVSHFETAVRSDEPPKDMATVRRDGRPTATGATQSAGVAQTYTYNPRASQCITAPTIVDRPSSQPEQSKLTSLYAPPQDHASLHAPRTADEAREHCVKYGGVRKHHTPGLSLESPRPRQPAITPTSPFSNLEAERDAEFVESTLALDFLSESIDSLEANATPPEMLFHPPVSASIGMRRLASFADTKLNPDLQTLLSCRNSEDNLQERQVDDKPRSELSSRKTPIIEVTYGEGVAVTPLDRLASESLFHVGAVLEADSRARLEDQLDEPARPVEIADVTQAVEQPEAAVASKDAEVFKRIAVKKYLASIERRQLTRKKPRDAITPYRRVSSLTGIRAL
ncbi:hypothetical protein LTR95_000698 [Oleoguttula sp. CCFEE 5521]